MPHINRARKAAPATETPISSANDARTTPYIQPLTDADYTEILAFLAARSVDTIFMSGLIRDNGVASDLNRGKFYGCRDAAGQLEGIALVGHATLVEARTDRAVSAFARLAREAQAHVIVGDQEKVETFWTHYEQGGQQ